MPASLPYAPCASAPESPSLQFGEAEAGAPGSVHWVLKRNCSLSPRQTVAFYGSLCVLSAAIAAFCWLQGATFVVAFAGLEILAVGAALVVYARHAADREILRLHAGTLTVCRVSGAHSDEVEFSSAWVRVEPRANGRALIELSGQGRSVLVGHYLRPERRRVLVAELRDALGRARAYPASWSGAPVEDTRN